MLGQVELKGMSLNAWDSIDTFRKCYGSDVDQTMRSRWPMRVQLLQEFFSNIMEGVHLSTIEKAIRHSPNGSFDSRLGSFTMKEIIGPLAAAWVAGPAGPQSVGGQSRSQVGEEAMGEDAVLQGTNDERPNLVDEQVEGDASQTADEVEKASLDAFVERAVESEVRTWTHSINFPGSAENLIEAMQDKGALTCDIGVGKTRVWFADGACKGDLSKEYKLSHSPYSRKHALDKEYLSTIKDVVKYFEAKDNVLYVATNNQLETDKCVAKMAKDLNYKARLYMLPDFDNADTS
jgi:hypothetical protein